MTYKCCIVHLCVKMESRSARVPIGHPPPWTQPARMRLPLHHPLRVSQHDAKLWNREQIKAAQTRPARMRCPCTHCQGSHTRVLREIHGHLAIHGRHPRWRVANDPNDDDSSDDEWRAEFDNANTARREQFFTGGLTEVVAGLGGPTGQQHSGDAGIHVQQMVQDIFQDLDAFHDDMEAGTMEECVEEFPTGDEEESADEFEIGEEDDGGQAWMFGSPIEI